MDSPYSDGSLGFAAGTVSIKSLNLTETRYSGANVGTGNLLVLLVCTCRSIDRPLACHHLVPRCTFDPYDNSDGAETTGDEAYSNDWHGMSGTVIVSSAG